MATGPHLPPGPLRPGTTAPHVLDGRTPRYWPWPPGGPFSSQPLCWWLHMEPHAPLGQGAVCAHSILCLGAGELGPGARPWERSGLMAPLKLCAVAPSGPPRSELWVHSGAGTGQEAQEEAGGMGHSARIHSAWPRGRPGWPPGQRRSRIKPQAGSPRSSGRR